MEKVKMAMEFMEKNYGDDIEIVSVEVLKDDVKFIWNEVGDEDKYFSIVGKGRYGKMVEKIGGEC